MRRASSRNAMIGGCASCSARLRSTAISGRCSRSPVRSRLQGTSLRSRREASWHPHVVAEGFDAIAAGPSHAEAIAHYDRFRAEVEALRSRRAAAAPLHAHLRRGPRHVEAPGAARRRTGLRPDPIVYESGDLAAPAVAAALEVPVANHSFGVMVPFAAVERAASTWRRCGGPVGARARPVRRRVSRSLHRRQPAQLRVGAATRGQRSGSGTCRRRSRVPPTGWTTLGQPLVYVTLGTVFNRPATFRALLDGLDGSSALVTTGRNVDPASLGDRPPNVRIERFVPQAQVLPRCAAVVAHAGSGSVTRLPRARPAARARTAGRGPVRQRRALRGCRRRGRRAAGGADGGGVRLALRRILDEPSFAEAARACRQRSRRCRPPRTSLAARGVRSRWLGWPRVARARTTLIVAALAALAAVVVAGAAVLSADERDSGAETAVEPQPREGFPLFVLSLGVRDDAEARELRRAAELYESGRRDEARRIFGRFDSLEAKLGAAFAAWPESEDRIEQLGALYPRSALVQLHVGLARFWAGTVGAVTAWREARDVEPDTPYAVRADDLIHPDFAPGLPTFVPSFPYSHRGRHAGGAARVAAAARPLCADGSCTGSRCSGSATRSRHDAPSPTRCGWRRTTSTRSSPTRSAATTRAIRRRRSRGSGR